MIGKLVDKPPYVCTPHRYAWLRVEPTLYKKLRSGNRSPWKIDHLYIDAFPLGKGGCSIREGKRATPWLTSRAYWILGLINHWFPLRPAIKPLFLRGGTWPWGGKVDQPTFTGTWVKLRTASSWGIGSEPFAWIPTTGGDGALSDEEMIVLGYIWDHFPCSYMEIIFNKPLIIRMWHCSLIFP